MLTIFTSPKDFKGHFAVIQENAIASWCKFRPKCQIILLGNGYKVAEIAKRYHILHIPDVVTNKFGTPTLSDIFKKTYSAAKFMKLAYINCDIILMDDFIEAVKAVSLPSFFLTGRRWNLDIKTKLDFKKGWQEKLKARISKESELGRYGANDYFVFTPRIDFQMPDFAVGRTSFDNWLVFKAKFLKIPVVDATNVIYAIHQSHDYSHAGGYHKVWHGPESEQNRKLVGDHRKLFNVKNADYILTKKGLVNPKITFAGVIREIETMPVLKPRITPYISSLIFLIKSFRFIFDKAKRLM